MADELRSCRRTGCRWPAAASLSYRYDSRQVWLSDLAEPSHPALYDLCPHHADHLTLPNGWHLVDQRTTPEVIVEPAAADRVAQPLPPSRVGAARSTDAPRYPDLPRSADSEGSAEPHEAGGNPEHVRSSRALVAGPVGHGTTTGRYAALTAELPRLAAALAGQLASSSPEPEPARHATQRTSPPPAPPAGSAARPSWAIGAHGQIPGQLAIPVDDLPPLGRGRGAVVVSIERAGGRRREARDTEL